METDWRGTKHFDCPKKCGNKIKVKQALDTDGFHRVTFRCKCGYLPENIKELY